MINLFKYMNGHWKYAFFGATSKFLEASMELIFPLLMALIIDNGIIAGDRHYIIRYSTIMIIVAILATIFTIMGQFWAAKAAHQMGQNIRNDLYSHIHTLSVKETNKLNTLSLINRVNNDTAQVERGVAFFIRLALRCPIICVGAIILALILDVPLTLVLITIIPIITIFLIIMLKRSVRFQSITQEKLDIVSKSVKENITGLRDIKSYNKTELEIKEFLNDNENWQKYGIKATKTAGSVPPFTNLLLHIGISAIIFLGAQRVASDIVTPGVLVAFISYVNIMVGALILFTHLTTNFSKAFASSKRIKEVFNMTSSIDYGSVNNITFNENLPILEIKDIEFKYQNKINLKIDGTIRIYQGNTIGIIGATGSGKSTLAKLIVRLYDPLKGQILLNNIDLKDYSNEFLRKQILIVMQNDSLLNMSIKDNLNMKRQLSEEKLIDILKIAQAFNFVKEKNGFLNFLVNEDTKNLSGGQKQRLTIARALAQEPKILILDDSFFALDYKTDYDLRKALTKNFPNMTKIIISQRISTIKDCDLILVLNDGLLECIGKHSDLLNSCSVYQEIQNSQKKENDNDQ